MPAKPSTILGAALLLAAAGSASAQKLPPDQSAPENVRQSQRYEEVLHSNPSFRAKRMQEECGPIQDKEMHDQCLASFGGGEPPMPKRPSRPKS